MPIWLFGNINTRDISCCDFNARKHLNSKLVSGEIFGATASTFEEKRSIFA